MLNINYKVGDWYYTKDEDGDVCGYLFVARQGHFIIGASEYSHCSGDIEAQLNEMCEETLENQGVTVYIHNADLCYSSYEEALND